MTRWLAPFVCLAAWLLCGAASAQPLASYAIVIGSDEGGHGQARLSFALRDAERMAQLVRELGHTPRENVTLLRHPSPQDVQDSIARVRTQLAERARLGERSQLLFYYSGHARAQALNLGAEELNLMALRKQLLGLPSTLTVVVLDACQSGSFSNVKGAAPAADFSLSSVAGLAVEGVAVMASSTASELSQESPDLAGSYFTTHLIAALRGAADDNHDGRVSLDEAYRYAYERTLADTSRTAVGSQHATLETELKGRGDVPLTFPADARAQLVLGTNVSGRVLVMHSQTHAVMAEAVKARGAELTLGLPIGSYDVFVREEHSARDCSVHANSGTNVLDLGRCQPIALSEAGAKGESGAHESLFLEVGVGLRGTHDDAYTHTLEDFRFSDDSGGQSLRVTDFLNVARLGLTLHRNFALVLRYDAFRQRYYNRTLQGPDEQSRYEHFSWNTHALTLGGRGQYPLLHDILVPYLEGTLGFGTANTFMRGENLSEHERKFGLAMTGNVGLICNFIRPWFGAFVEVGYSYAPVVNNRIGETHDDGGYIVSTGLRVAAPEWK